MTAALFIRLSALPLLWLVLAGPAFGGRMIGPAEPDRFPDAAYPEVPDQAVIEMVDDEDEDMADSSELLAEQPEGSEDDKIVDPAAGNPPPRWKWSRSLRLGMSVDDNIYVSSRDKESDAIFTLGGDFQLLWGLKKDESYLSVDYSPSLVVFADHSDANGFDQKLGMAGQWRFTKLTLGAQVGAQTLSSGDVDVGDRANRSLWQIALTAKYDYSTKTSFEVDLAPNASNYSKYLDSIEWVNSNWIDYQAFPKTRVGAGLTFGYLKPEGGDAQTYQQALLRITKPLSGKVTANASGGMEFRHLGNGGGTQTTPVFRVGASYRPYDGTTISMEASRRIYSSAAMAGQNFVATGGTVSIRQRVFKRFFTTVAGGYEDANYQSTDGQEGAARHDQYFYIRPSVSFAFRKWISLELYYQYRSNTSTTMFSEFSSNVAGVQAGVTF